MSRSPRSIFLAALCATTALACGPHFPITIIDRADALTAAPFIRYQDSLARMTLPPAKFKAVNFPPPDYTEDTSELDEPTLVVELRDLQAAGVPVEVIAQHRQRRREIARLCDLETAAPLPAALKETTGLPTEFADYHAGACAYHEKDRATARAAWTRLLALPSAARSHRSVWAAFMLGRAADDPAEARRWFQTTRQLVRDGYRDSLGLAAASYGWEARTWLDAGDLAAASTLYLTQLATGDPGAAGSLRLVAQQLLDRSDEIQLARFARDPALRETVTALLLILREQPRADPDLLESQLPTGVTSRWLAALETAGVNDAVHAAPLALAAYRADDLAACQRWLGLAPTSDALAIWLRAKLALRAGRVDEGTALLAQLVQHSAALDQFAVFETTERPLRPGLDRVRGELGALKLARRDYTEALELLDAAGYDEDAAYIAEQVLTVDELKRYLDTRAAHHPTPTWESDERFVTPLDLRYLLSRRLARHDRLLEAQAYAPPATAAVVPQLAALVAYGRDPAHAAAPRAQALMGAARLLRAEGMELRGTELGPDYFIHGGDFDWGLAFARRAELPAPLTPSDDERTRAAPVAFGTQDKRFHYRYVAAEIAWEAIALMPDNHPDTAAALIEAGGWLKARDPQAANRFYRALVRRCGRTEPGRLAAAQRWFPH